MALVTVEPARCGLVPVAAGCRDPRWRSPLSSQPDARSGTLYRSRSEGPRPAPWPTATPPGPLPWRARGHPAARAPRTHPRAREWMDFLAGQPDDPSRSSACRCRRGTCPLLSTARSSAANSVSAAASSPRRRRPDQRDRVHGGHRVATGGAAAAFQYQRPADQTGRVRRLHSPPRVTVRAGLNDAAARRCGPTPCARKATPARRRSRRPRPHRATAHRTRTARPPPGPRARRGAERTGRPRRRHRRRHANVARRDLEQNVEQLIGERQTPRFRARNPSIGLGQRALAEPDHIIQRDHPGGEPGPSSPDHSPATRRAVDRGGAAKTPPAWPEFQRF